jgi:hypothetical protein
VPSLVVFLMAQILVQILVLLLVQLLVLISPVWGVFEELFFNRPRH